MNTELQKMNHNAFHGQKDVHTYMLVFFLRLSFVVITTILKDQSQQEAKATPIRPKWGRSLQI